jgi:hypothetical protein
MVILNSGRFDGADTGGFSNPGSIQWESGLNDTHKYPRTPCAADVIDLLRTVGPKPLFLSEYGIGSGVDLVRLTRHYEQRDRQTIEEAQVIRRRLDAFMASWKMWKLDEAFASPEDYFTQSLAKMAGQRAVGLNAIRANPNIVGHSMTSLVDIYSIGEGLLTPFREPKPGTGDVIFDAWYPLRLCLFVEPWTIYRGTKVQLEAVLANEDVLPPGQYPVRLQVIGPDNLRVFERTVTVSIPDRKSDPEPAFALPIFAEDVMIDGPAGKYRFLAAFARGGAAAGGRAEFYVFDPIEMPLVESEVSLWGEDTELQEWLIDHGIRVRPFIPGQQTTREVILISKQPAAPGGATAFAELARHIARGSNAVFLSAEPFQEGDQPLRWIPLVNKGFLNKMVSNLYHKDEWSKNHPIFAGLPAGGLLDYTLYRNVAITAAPGYGQLDYAYAGQDPPTEAVAGSIETSYFSGTNGGLLVAVHRLGAGSLILNLMRIRDNLGQDPVAEWLLRNMLRYAARDHRQPLQELPADFDTQLKALGYEPGEKGAYE